MSSVLLFAANDGGTGTEAWITNAEGTNATLVDLFPGPNGSFPNLFSATLGGDLYFAATDADAGTELFTSDGTVTGTKLFADIEFGPSSSFPFQFFGTTSKAIGDTLYFTAFDSDTGVELYKTTQDASNPVSLVRDLNAGSSSSNPNGFVDLNGTLIFSASDGTSGTELYRSDGTEAGTQRIIDLNPGSSSSFPFISQSNILNDKLFFAADDGTFGDELWMTDGTSAGTTLVRDINPGSTGSFASGLLELNGTLYFSATDGSNGTELWRTDGTEGGTSIVKDINNGSSSSFPGTLAKLGENLLFFANNGSNGTELWRSDGTGAGTTLVRDINGGSSSSFFGPANNKTGEDIVIFKDKGYFIATDGSNGFEVWQTDGTAGGTILFKDINAGSSGSTPQELTVADDLMYFGATDGTLGRELWVTDGTSDGTRIVKDVRVGSNDSFAQPIGVIDINVAPEAATLSSNTAAENATPGTVVGTLAAVDADGDTLSYLLTDDAGGRFSLSGDLLRITSGLDFETAQTHSVTVQAADPSGATSNQTFTVNVTNVVEAPDVPTLTTSAVAENSAVGTNIGTFAAVNPEGGAVTFSLIDNANGLFTLNGSQLQTAGNLDFETASSQTVTVRTTGASNTFTDATFTLAVSDVNEAPGAAALSGNTIAENAANATVGTLSAMDPEGDNVTFSLTDNAGGAFMLNGNALQTTSGLDFEAGATRSVTVQARDTSGLTSNQTFTVNVTDVAEGPSTTPTEGDDLLTGTPQNDVIDGLGGNDTINGLDGSDNLVGGAGNDSITGGTTEADLRDNIFGGEGDDTIRGGYGNDEVRGDAGNDLVEGGFGADTVFGGTGNDSITGGGFGDLLFGAEGDDFINGGFGFDRTNGGDGADEFFHLGVAGHGTDFIQDYDGSEGDVLVTGIAGATAGQFQINEAFTPNAGDAGVAEAFVIYRPTGQIMWALIDGAGQDEINLQIQGDVFDLMV